jgi:peroxiredoxin
MNDQAVCAPATLAIALADGGQVDIADFCGQKLVIFFCGGDATEMQREIDSYDRLAEEFQHAGGWVIGIAGPSLAPAPERTPRNHVHIGLDADGAIFNALAARCPTVELNGRTGATILIDRGAVRRAWPGTGHAAEALAAVRERR